jgi:hypothetical protein
MDRMTIARDRLAQAADLPALLAAACDAFEDIIATLRRHQDDCADAFPAFILAAAAAGNGRDWIASAPSLPAAATGPVQPEPGTTPGRHWSEAAAAVARIANVLADKLTRQAATAADPDDQAACASAASYATRIHALLANAAPS